MDEPTLILDIVVIEEEPSELENFVSIYLNLTASRESDGHWGRDIQGSVSAAKSLTDAERILKVNLSKRPRVIQILHLREKSEGEKGSEFVLQMKRAFPDAYIGALLLTESEMNVSAANSLGRGEFRYVSKPMAPSIIKGHIKDVVEVLSLKDEPVGRCFEGKIHFRKVEKEEDLMAFLKLRFSLWEKLGFIPQENISYATKMEIDEYDKVSIPLGGFLVEGRNERLVTAVRIITTKSQEDYAKKYFDILKNYGDEILTRSFEREIKSPFIMAENYSLDSFLDSMGISYNDCVEFSRYICVMRGMGISFVTSSFLYAYARDALKAKLGLAQCRPQHVEMNIRNGFKGIVPGTGPVQDKRVQQCGQALYIDLQNIHNNGPKFPRSLVDMISSRYFRDGHFYYCKEADECINFGIEFHDSIYCS